MVTYLLICFKKTIPNVEISEVERKRETRIYAKEMYNDEDLYFYAFLSYILLMLLFLL